MMQAFNGRERDLSSEGVSLLKRWQTLAICSLGFWLSCSAILDLVIMPTLWATGMMEGSGFASASYSIFWVAHVNPTSIYARQEMRVGALMLLAIALSYTFILTPYMSGLAMDVDILALTKSIPAEMSQMHSIYWVLEASKLGIAGMLLSWCARSK
jgi:hypothetical protein